MILAQVEEVYRSANRPGDACVKLNKNDGYIWFREPSNVTVDVGDWMQLDDAWLYWCLTHPTKDPLWAMFKLLSIRQTPNG